MRMDVSYFKVLIFQTVWIWLQTLQIMIYVYLFIVGYATS